MGTYLGRYLVHYAWFLLLLSLGVMEWTHGQMVADDKRFYTSSYCDEDHPAINPFSDAIGVGLLLKDEGYETLLSCGAENREFLNVVMDYCNLVDVKVVAPKSKLLLEPFGTRGGMFHFATVEELIDCVGYETAAVDVLMLWIAEDMHVSIGEMNHLLHGVKPGGMLMIIANNSMLLQQSSDDSILEHQAVLLAETVKGQFAEAILSDNAGIVTIRRPFLTGKVPRHPSYNDVTKKYLHIMTPRNGIKLTLFSSEMEVGRKVPITVMPFYPNMGEMEELIVKFDDEEEPVEMTASAQGGILTAVKTNVKVGKHKITAELKDIEYGQLFVDSVEFEVVEMKNVPPTTVISGIDHIFVCHWAPLTARREFLEKNITGLGIEPDQVTWLTDFDRHNITNEFLETYYNPSKAGWEKRYEWHRPESVFRNLSIGEICVTACHVKAYELIAQRGYQGAIVLEDDTVFDANFTRIWNDYMEKLKPNHWDYVFFGLGDQNYVDDRMSFFPAIHPASRTAGSYAISRYAAEILQSSMVPFSSVSDGEMDYQMWMHNLKVYWSSPHLSWEGTKKNRDVAPMFSSVVDELREMTETHSWIMHILEQSQQNNPQQPTTTASSPSFIPQN